MGTWYNRSDNERKYIIFEEDNINIEFNSVAFGMLMNNNILSLIPCSVSQTDNKRTVVYNVSSYQKFQDFLEQETTFEFIHSLFTDMCNSVIMLRRYMINTENLIFDEDKMYIDLAASKIKFLVSPLRNGNGPVDLRAVFRNVIVNLKLNKRDTQNVGAILSMLNKTEFSPETFLEDLKSFGKSSGAAYRSFYNTGSAHSEKNNAEYSARNLLSQDIRRDIYKQPDTSKAENKHTELPQTTQNQDNKKNGSIIGKLFSKKKQSLNEKVSSMDGLAIPGKEDTGCQAFNKIPAEAADKKIPDNDVTMLEEDNDVTVLLSEARPCPRLINKATNETVSIEKDFFRIGRDSSRGLDLIINTKLVSHYHATIIFKNDLYYIIDENSTNHVFVNGQIIPVKSEFLLNIGDTVKIGSEEFIFEI